VSAYLVTKAVAAGALMIAALLVLLGDAGYRGAVGVLPAVLAGAFTLVTGVLLVADLKQPKRFFYLLTRPNWRSWLTRGAVILGLYAALAMAWLVAGLAGWETGLKVLAIPALLLGAATAGYTAYLFGQCEGRDLWQTPLLLPVLLGQAAVAGAAAMLILGVFVHIPDAGAVRWTMVAAIAAVGLFAAAELTAKGPVHVEMAVAAMTRTLYARRFWAIGVLLGLVAPAVLLLAGSISGADRAFGALAGIAAIAGLAGYEDAFVRAGQSVPLS
jgi:Ni/Fe-hydrogenase subunit HybB-like protein